MTPIEHFLIDIIQILFRDWKENTIADIGRCEATTDIFQPALRKYFTNAGRWYFFTVEGAFFLGVAVKIYNVGRQGFFVRAQPKLCFGRHIIQGLNRQNNTRHKSLNSHDWYFPADIAQAFLQTVPIIFFYGRGCCFVRCCRKILQCRSARFFRSSSTEVVFRRTPACFHLLGKESISPPKKKTGFTDTDRKKC